MVTWPSCTTFTRVIFSFYHYCCAGSILVGTSCDEEIIPNITHATFRISKGDVRYDFTYPMAVTYACDKGYDLLDPDRYVVECEFPAATPQWKNFSGVICGKFKPVDQITIIKGSAQLTVF